MSVKEKDKKDQLLTLRVPKRLIAKLEKVRDQYIEKGEKRSVAHIVRNSLEDAIDEYHDLGEAGRIQRVKRVFELQKNEAETLASIRQMVIDGTTIPRAEWEYLCLQSASAYRLRDRDVYNSALLMDVVKAFRDYVAYRKKRTNQPFPDARYFQSNLLSQNKSSHGSSLEDDIEYTLAEIGETPISKVGGYFIARNTEVCLRDETLPLKDEDVHEFFKPYARSLLTLSARHYYVTSQRNTGKQQSYAEYLGHDWVSNRWSKRYEENGFAISIERRGESVTAAITVGDGPKSYMHSFDFPELEDFFSAVTHDLVVGSCQGYDDTKRGDKYCLVKFNHGKDSACLEKPEYECLKCLLADIKKDFEYIKICNEAKLVYGDI